MAPKKALGFTLIELMVVVAIVAILAAIALPSFADQVRTSRRAEAVSTMQNAQLKLERWRVDHRDFTGSGVSLSDTNYYDFSITAAPATPNSYSLTAAPLGDQVNDKCGTLTLANNAGVISKTAAVTSGCW